MLKKGKYRHYKGNYYEVIGVARHSESEEEMVVYKTLYTNEKGEQTLWVRPRKMFEETVVAEGKVVPRFQFVSE